MKKYGKFEKQTEAVPAKQPKVKNALLQTYFTSLLSLVLCVAMFLGTSYAWFTSEVTNEGNEIYIGTLEAELDKQLAEGTWGSLSEKANGINTNKLFDSSIRWEPGYTSLETVRVTNQGDLAFNYVLTLTDGAATKGGVAGDLVKIAENFVVYVHTGDYAEDEAKPANFQEMKESAEWISVKLDNGEVATLADILTKGLPVLTGSSEKSGEADTFIIALHMKEEADASVMGYKISLNVKLVAYQKGYEGDDLGGNNYDLLVATESDLREALQNGGQVTLLEDIVLTEGVSIPADTTVNLDLNGHTISTTTDVVMSMITNNGTLNVNDGIGGGEIALTFNGAVDDSAAVNAISNRGTMTVNGGQISNTNVDGQIGYAIDNYNGATLTVDGGEISATGSYSDGIRLFCGSNATVVTVNGGKISSIWAQNPSTNKATEVSGVVILNGGDVTTTYYENYTIVKVAAGVTANVQAYGNGSDETIIATEKTAEKEYTVYYFSHDSQNATQP